MIKGDFQGTDGYLPYDQILRLKEAKNVQILEAESMRVFYFSMHNGRSLMNDVHFRKALAYAFDYDGFIKDILKGAVARNPSPNPNNLWGAPKDLKGFTYDLEKAKAELAQVKEPLRPITIGTLAGFSETEQAAALLQNGAKKIGIEIKIESAPWPVVQSRMQDRDKNYDMVPLWNSTYYADPNNWVGELYGSRYIGTRNSSYYKDAELDELDRRGARDQRPGKAPRAVREGGDEGDRAGDGHLRLQHEVVRPLRRQRRRHPLQPDRQRTGHALGLLQVSSCHASSRSREPPARSCRGSPRLRGRKVATSRMRRLEMILSRLVWFVPTMAGLVVIVFLISNVIPTDPVAVLLGENATPAQIEAMRVKLGYDQPLWVQLARHFHDIVSGNLGTSIYSQRPIAEDLWTRLPATLELTLAAITLSVALGIPLGVLSAL